MKKEKIKNFDFRDKSIDSSKSSIEIALLPLAESAFESLCKENKKVIDAYVFWKEKIDELKYRLDYTYKLFVVKNRDAKGSILARVKWQFKYKGEYRKPAHIGVYIGSLNDFPKGLEENNIHLIAKQKIDEYLASKVPLELKDINGKDYTL
ncbi:hypothetical protein GCM10011508_07900 [Flavobacterium lutivivi]|nr:hypothetical protein GCM10011508_07900 [Flavobacterium lutivivi]